MLQKLEKSYTHLILILFINYLYLIIIIIIFHTMKNVKNCK